MPDMAGQTMVVHGKECPLLKAKLCIVFDTQGYIYIQYTYIYIYVCVFHMHIELKYQCAVVRMSSTRIKLGSIHGPTFGSL